MEKKGLTQANTLRSNNTTSTGYGIVYADEIIGSRSVKTKEDLNKLPDWVLGKDNKLEKGTTYYVENEKCFYIYTGDGWQKSFKAIGLPVKSWYAYDNDITGTAATSQILDISKIIKGDDLYVGTLDGIEEQPHPFATIVVYNDEVNKVPIAYITLFESSDPDNPENNTVVASAKVFGSINNNTFPRTPDFNNINYYEGNCRPLDTGTQITNWRQTGGVYTMDKIWELNNISFIGNPIKTSDIDFTAATLQKFNNSISDTSHNICAQYSVVDVTHNNIVGQMLLIGDSLGHMVTEILTTSATLNNGVINWNEHSDTVVNTYIRRNHVKEGGTSGIAVGSWSKWTYYSGEGQYNDFKILVAGELSKKVNTSDVVQQTGDSTTSVMSQKAVTKALKDSSNEIKGEIIELDNKVSNLPDDEDITSVDDGTGSNVLKFADRTYNPDNFSGKGYKILRKNIQSVNIASTKLTITEVPSSDGALSFTINGKETQIAVSASTDNTTELVAQKVAIALQDSMTEYDVSIDASLITLTKKSSGSVTPSIFSASTTGVVCTITDSTKEEFRNILTAAMINQPNTIYEIRYNFDLDGGFISLPENVSLIFNGGSFSNGVVEPKNCCIYSKFKSPIFIDIVFKKNDNYVIGNELYDYYFKDTNRDDDYLILYNLLFGNPAIITAPVLNIKTFINPYYKQYKKYGVMERITSMILNLEGNNAVINILADLDTKERPFTGIDQWGINTPSLITVGFNSISVSVRNVTFIDDKSINGYGADFTKTIYSYNGQEKNVRGWLISASFDKLEKLVFENVNARTACELFGTNSWGKSKSYIDVLFNNVNVYSHTNFCIEIWGHDIGAASVVYNNCTFEINYGSTCLISNSALISTFAIYRNCTFKNGCLSEVGNYRCENCLFYNAQYIYTTTDSKIEIINCTFEIDKLLKTVKGGFFDLFSKDCLIKDSKFNIHKNNYVTFRIAKLANVDNITTNKVTVINTNIPVTAEMSISDEYIKLLDFTFINMWKEDPSFNSKNSGFVSSIVKLKGIYYNCGYVFDRILPERCFGRNKSYLSWLNSSYPVIYQDNIEDSSKIVLDDLVVYSKKSLTMNFNGETEFSKYLTIKLGVVNSGTGNIKVYTSNNNTISIQITRKFISINVNNQIMKLNFQSIKYRDLAISFDLEKLLIYPFIDGTHVIISSGSGSMTKDSIQLNGNVDLNINGAGFKYMMFQPIMLYKDIY